MLNHTKLNYNVIQLLISENQKNISYRKSKTLIIIIPNRNTKSANVSCRNDPETYLGIKWVLLANHKINKNFICSVVGRSNFVSTQYIYEPQYI